MAQEISALVFDAYGTIFDVHSVGRLAETHFPGKGALLSSTWRGKQLEYTWLRTLMGHYEDFNRVTRSALDWSLESLGLEADETVKRALVDEYRRLTPFADARPALEKLAEGRPLAILSNGYPEMLEAVVDHSGLRPIFRGGILSVHCGQALQARPGRVSHRGGSARRHALAHRLRVVQRMGCGRREIIRLPRLLGESRRGAGRAPGRAARRDGEGPGRAGEPARPGERLAFLEGLFAPLLHRGRGHDHDEDRARSRAGSR
jgi:2-haloalkanoic acid dehalogenase type II